jgi:hypothetical protein
LESQTWPPLIHQMIGCFENVFRCTYAVM